GKSGNAYTVGEVFEAELVYFPSSAPLRAIIAQQIGPAAQGGPWPRPPDDLASAAAGLTTILAARPWSADLPLAAHGARVVAAGKDLWLADATASIGLPIRDEDDFALTLLGLEGIDVFGRWDGHSLALGLCETPIGRWTAT